jgi:inorganic triphosphatase YgiF
VPETELKLALAPEDLARLARHPALHSGAVPARRQRLRAVYYDTPAHDLWQRGIALRVRREGGRWIQTVKHRGEVVAGLHRRGEEEVAVRGPQPDFDVIGTPELAAVFASPELRASLVPVFMTDVFRVTRVVQPAPGLVIEVAFDRGTIAAGAREAPVCELELELKSGPAWRLFELALQIADAVPACVDVRSKAERGFALAGVAPSPPRKALPSGVRAGMTVSEGFAATALGCLTQYQANQHGLAASSDIEYLHQARVGLRRLRSAFTLFRAAVSREVAAPHIGELRSLARALGPARDWDVFAVERLPQVAGAFGGVPGVRLLARAVARRRRPARAQARRAAASRAVHRFQLALAGWLAGQAWLAEAGEPERARLEAPVREFAIAALDECYRRVRRGGRNFGALGDPELHALRIRVKRLRYAAEFLAPLFPPADVKPFRDAAVRLQDLLGHLNDAATAATLLDEAVGPRPGAALREGRALVLGWSAAQAGQARARLADAWRRMRNVPPFWR